MKKPQTYINKMGDYVIVAYDEDGNRHEETFVRTEYYEYRRAWRITLREWREANLTMRIAVRKRREANLTT